VVHVEIFDPPLCCPTGVCGPTVDPALLDAQEALLRLRTEFDGRVRVERYALGQQPAKFMAQPEVVARLKAEGVGTLPVTVIDGRVVKERAYLDYDALRVLVEAALAPQVQEAP
jgi:hypothetical protein